MGFQKRCLVYFSYRCSFLCATAVKPFIASSISFFSGPHLCLPCLSWPLKNSPSPFSETRTVCHALLAHPHRHNYCLQWQHRKRSFCGRLWQATHLKSANKRWWQTGWNSSTCDGRFVTVHKKNNVQPETNCLTYLECEGNTRRYSFNEKAVEILNSLVTLSKFRLHFACLPRSSPVNFFAFFSVHVGFRDFWWHVWKLQMRCFEQKFCQCIERSRDFIFRWLRICMKPASFVMLVLFFFVI